MTHTTSVLLRIKYWTVWCIEHYSMSTYTGVTNCQKTVRFFWPTLYNIGCWRWNYLHVLSCNHCLYPACQLTNESYLPFVCKTFFLTSVQKRQLISWKLVYNDHNLFQCFGHGTPGAHICVVWLCTGLKFCLLFSCLAVNNPFSICFSSTNLPSPNWVVLL